MQISVCSFCFQIDILSSGVPLPWWLLFLSSLFNCWFCLVQAQHQIQKQNPYMGYLNNSCNYIRHDMLNTFFLFPITLSGSISVIKHQLIPSVSTSLSPVLYSVSFLNSIIICLAMGREEEDIHSLILLQLLWKIVVSQDESISYCNHWHYDIIANIILNVPLAQASQDFTTLLFFIPCYLGYPYFFNP